MPISLVRVDDRLMHVQVVEGWMKAFAIEKVLVISDKHAKDNIAQTLMKIAVPKGVEVNVMNVEDSIGWLKENHTTEEDVMILTASLREMLILLQNGIELPFINLGGLHYPEGKIKLSPAVILSEEDFLLLKQITGMGVKVVAHSVPNEAPIDLVDFLNNFGCA